MKSKNDQSTAAYVTPAVTTLQLSQEGGALCGSFENERFKGLGENDTAPSYGTGFEDYGWY